MLCFPLVGNNLAAVIVGGDFIGSPLLGKINGVCPMSGPVGESICISSVPPAAFSIMAGAITTTAT